MDKKNEKSSIAEKFKKLKHKEIIVAVVAVMVMLAIYFSSYLTKGTESASYEKETGSDYCSKMESDVLEAVKKLSGDKNAKVIVNWETSVEAVIAYATSTGQNSSSSQPTIVQNGNPVVLKEIYPKALGVAILISGGDNVKLRLDITGMVSTLLDISPEKIAVYSSN